MTRINCIPVEELTNRHAQAEYREIVRPFALVRRAQQNGVSPYNLRARYKIPEDYTLGTGHVVFFYDKLQYLLNRYKQLQAELTKRKFELNPVPEEALKEGIRPCWFGDYIPTKQAQEINRARIAKRLSGDKT